jgi:hypothetical protein
MLVVKAVSERDHRGVEIFPSGLVAADQQDRCPPRIPRLGLVA